VKIFIVCKNYRHEGYDIVKAFSNESSAWECVHELSRQETDKYVSYFIESTDIEED
jgi:hypothetical protein